MTTAEALAVLAEMCPELAESQVARKVLQQIWRQGYDAGYEDATDQFRR